MAIEANETVVAAWSVELGMGNWLALLSNDNGRLKLQCRFRWYRDDKIGRESKDKRNFYDIDLRTHSQAEAILKLREVFDEFMEKSLDPRGWELIRGQRTLQEFMDEFLKMPGIHSRVMSKEEFDEQHS